MPGIQFLSTTFTIVSKAIEIWLNLNYDWGANLVNQSNSGKLFFVWQFLSVHIIICQTFSILELFSEKWHWIEACYLQFPFKIHGKVCAYARAVPTRNKFFSFFLVDILFFVSKSNISSPTKSVYFCFLVHSSIQGVLLTIPRPNISVIREIFEFCKRHLLEGQNSFVLTFV